MWALLMYFTALCIAEWSKITPLTYLGPFLEVIRSPETSGPITGIALTSVRRLLNQYLFGEGHLICSLQHPFTQCFLVNPCMQLQAANLLAV